MLVAVKARKVLANILIFICSTRLSLIRHMFEYDKMYTTFTLLANIKAPEDLSTRWSVRRTTYQNVDSSEEYLL